MVDENKREDLGAPLFIKLSDEYVKPKAVEEDNDRWVMIGENDDYYDYVDECYEYSTTNNAIINSLSLQIYGEGIDATDSATKPQGYVELKKLVKPRDFRKIAADLARYTSYAVLMIMSKDGKKVAKMSHVAMRTVRPEKCDDNGRIMNFGVSWNWEEVRDKGIDPDYIYPNWEHKEQLKGKKAYLYVVRPYSPAHFYFGPVSYQGGLKYAEIERRLASFRLNLIRKGFTATTMVNFNNGIPEDKKERRRIEDGIKAKFTAEYNDEPDTIAVTFNADKEHAPTIESVPINDAATQFEEISKEASSKLIVAHRITSPMLVGIKQDVGLGNNADEIKTAYQLYDNLTVRPMKNLLLESVEEALAFNGVILDLYVKTLTPIEYTDTTEAVTFEEKEKETGVKMSAVPDITAERLDALAEYLVEKGESEEDLLAEHELYDVNWADDEDENTNLEAYLNREFTNLNANEESSQDTEQFKVRYSYKKTTKGSVEVDRHRPLCDRLVNAGLLYRKEDITTMSSAGGAEDQGQEYNVFLYKGGVNCQHGWERRIYRKRLKKNGEPWGGGAMNGVTRVQFYDAVRAGVKFNRREDKKAFTAPRDTPTKGAKS